MPDAVLLVATDFSEPSRRAADFAAGLARTTGARVRLVHVVEPLQATEPADPEASEFHRDLMEKARQNLSLESARLALPDCEEIVVLGPRVATLLAMAEASSPWMLVFGRDLSAQPYLGVSLQCLLQANCPVLSVS